jgi:hypothetical protein
MATYSHHFKLPQVLTKFGVRTSCAKVEDVFMASSSRDTHVLVADLRAVSCTWCLARHGIAPAGPRFVDANGAEVEA